MELNRKGGVCVTVKRMDPEVRCLDLKANFTDCHLDRSGQVPRTSFLISLYMVTTYGQQQQAAHCVSRSSCL